MRHEQRNSNALSATRGALALASSQPSGGGACRSYVGTSSVTICMTLPGDLCGTHKFASLVAAATAASSALVTNTGCLPATTQCLDSANRYILEKWPPGSQLAGCYLEKELQSTKDAVVYQAMKDSEKCAVKVVRKRCDSNVNELPAEVKVMQRIGEHANILALKEFYVSNDAYVMRTELCQGDLLDFINDRCETREGVSEHLVAHIMAQLFSAVLCLHLNGVTHNDIKRENILTVGSLENDELTVKLCDFGCAQPNLKWSSQLQSGTSTYWAPEKKLFGLQGTFGDVWCLGALLCELVLDYCPLLESAVEPKGGRRGAWRVWCALYQDAPPRHVLEYLRQNCDRFGSLPPLLQELISTMLHPSPCKRASVLECLKSEWLIAVLGEPRIRELLGKAVSGVIAPPDVIGTAPPPTQEDSSPAGTEMEVEKNEQQPRAPAPEPAVGAASSCPRSSNMTQQKRWPRRVSMARRRQQHDDADAEDAGAFGIPQSKTLLWQETMGLALAPPMHGGAH